MDIVDLGVIGFDAAFAIQEKIVEDVAAGRAEDTLLLLEHTPVYTIGSGGSLDNLLDPRVEVRRINRGGDITYHGPGQLVGYPLVDLSSRRRDLHLWLRLLEQLVIDLAAGFGVRSGRIDGRTGVWTGLGKLASIGVGVRRWVTMHGFALNVAADIDGFDRINPCGIERCPMTCLEIEAGRAVSVGDVKEKLGCLFVRMLEEWLPLASASPQLSSAFSLHSSGSSGTSGSVGVDMPVFHRRRGV